VPRTVHESPAPAFRSLDLIEPTRSDLESVASDFGLTATAVQDCLDPEHLTELERFGGASFVKLRAADERADASADNVQAFTRKVAIFWGADFLITIHRKEQPYLSAVLRDIYLIKRRVTMAKRLLWRTLSIATRLPATGDRAGPLMQDLRENAERMHFYADELLEDVTNLLNMQLAQATHRTNEVAQVLTIFSAFFLPLTFIAGVNGMNFEHMPEISHPSGYPAAWVVMFAVSAAIWSWFRRRGWMS
jgi:magnesium transporter